MERVPPRPDILSLGPATRMVSVSAVAQELRVTEREATDWLRSLGLTLVDVVGRNYVHTFYLELVLWWLGRGLGGPLHALKEWEREFGPEIEKYGRIYAGLNREAIRKRLSGMLGQAGRAKWGERRGKRDGGGRGDDILPVVARE